MVVVAFEYIFVLQIIKKNKTKSLVCEHGDHFKYNTCSLVSAMMLYRRMASFILSVGFIEITDKN